jgi:mono/diheme cytochrome c family protein
MRGIIRGIIRLWRAVAATGVAACLLLAAGAAMAQAPIPAARGAWPPTAAEILSRPIADSVANADQLRRGQYLVAAGDCMSCHLRAGGEPLAGGLGLQTPFGVIYSANITPDESTGIGAWTQDQFYRAMHDGIDDQGQNLYPAFPYPSFRRTSRADNDAIFAFLKTVPAVKYTPPKNHLAFPMNLRPMVKIWNRLFLDAEEFQANPSQTAEWNRGAYIVTGFGHCGGCHTPKNALGADESKRDLHGGTLDNWVAPDLTSNERTGLGGWTIDDVIEYLRHGRNAHAGAGGAMAEVVTYSTAWMSDADLRAIAVYLKSRAASTGIAPAEPDAGAMRRGAAIYSDACASCHLEDGVGQPRLFPPLGRNAMLQQADPTGLAHLILGGSRIGISVARPSALAMPSFAWKLNDAQIADVATFLRNSWGNRAGPVSSSAVHEVREHLDLETPHFTANSGDRE